MNLRISILLLALFFISTHSQDLVCTNCKCVEDHSNTEFKRGDQIALCVHFVTKSSGEVARTLRASYLVEIDQYTMVELKNGQDKFTRSSYVYGDDKVYIVLQPHGSVKSYPIPYVQLLRNRELDFYANVYSAVITIHDGIIKNVIWDDRCPNGKEGDCREIELATDTKDSIFNNKFACQELAAKCDPKIYISWIGNDKSGTKMTSTGTRLARFKDNLPEVYKSAEALTDIPVQTETISE